MKFWSKCKKFKLKAVFFGNGQYWLILQAEIVKSIKVDYHE